MMESGKTPQNHSGKKTSPLDKIKDLPSLPQVLVGVSKIARDPKSSASNLAEVILKDQALTLKILKIANSAQYSLSGHQVGTVSRAVVLLGFDSVRSIALGLGAFHLLSSMNRGGGVLKDFWTHAVSTAVVAQDLAEFMGMQVIEEVFVAGLLHDVGKLVLAEYDPEKACSIYAGNLSGPGLLAAETREFGINHIDMGKELAVRWKLPEDLLAAIVRHHNHFPAPPTERGDQMAFLVGVAKVLARPLWDGNADPRELASKMARVLRKPVGPLMRTLEKAPKAMETFAQFFEIQVEDLKTYTLWVEEENRRLTDVFQNQEEERRLIEKRQAEMSAMKDSHELLLQEADVDKVVSRTLKGMREAAGARRVLLCRMLNNELKPAWGQGETGMPSLSKFSFKPPFQEGIVAHALTRGQAINVFDVDLPYFQRLFSQEEKDIFDAPAFALLPLKIGKEILGLLYADRKKEDDPFNDADMEILRNLLSLAAIALQRQAMMHPGS